MRRVLNNHGMEPRARLCRLSFSSPSRRTQAGIPREMFYSGTPRAPARAGTSCCPSIRRLNAPAQVAATAICIQSTLQFGSRKGKGAPTSSYAKQRLDPYPSRYNAGPFVNPVISADACCANYRDGENHGVSGYARGGDWLVWRKGCVERLDERASRRGEVCKIRCGQKRNFEGLNSAKFD